MERVKSWRKLGEGFGLFHSQLDDIQCQHGSDRESCLKAVVEEFLLGEGRYNPSWRRVIYALDMIDEIHLADKVKDYGESVQGE